MEMNSCLLAGSSNRDEILIIRRPLDSTPHQSQQQEQSLRICQICGDEVGLTPEGEHFAACHECAFPICQNCYEYERREGSQVCPQCKTRLRRLKGYPRVEGDEDEDDVDDLENEFNFHRKMEEGTQNADSNPQAVCGSQEIPLLTEKETSEGTPQHQHAIIISPANGVETKRILSLRVPSPVQPAAHSRSINPSKDLTAYGFGTVAWREKMGNMDQIQEKSDGDTDRQDLPLMAEVNQLSRKLPIPSSQINPYRLIIIIRLVLLGLFLCYRVMNPVKDAYALWLVSVICEIWFSLSWIIDQFTKWQPIQRETNLDKLSSRFENKGQRSQLAAVDIIVNAADPLKKHPLATANTVLSVLAVDYPVDKVSCYVSDDGASMLTFEVLSETTEFARKWVPFCSRFNIEPRAPEWYFSQKIDYLKDKALPEFVRERRVMKREYEEYKVRINSLVAKSREVPEEGWTMPDGTPWPGNDVQDHHGMIQIFCGKSQEKDMDVDNGLPCLIYVSREKRPGFNHHKKAGAINALIRVSAVLTNAPYLLNLDCDCYINNSKVLKEAMCFMMDPLRGRRVCYVQFPHSFDISQNDDYANQNNLFFSINMKGLDGIQGPLCIGNGCVFRRQALYGYDPPKTRKKKNGMFNCWPKWYRGGYSLLEKKKEEFEYNSEMKPIVRQEGSESSTDGAEDVKVQAESINFSEDEVQRKLGQSSVFIASTLQEFGGAPRNISPATLLKEAIHVISCAYEDKTQWGKEVGWIYGSDTDNILTSFQMHSHGWRSIYYIPPRPAFIVSLPSNFPDRLQQVLRNAVGSTEIFLSRRCPLWYGNRGDLKFLQRLAYINATIYPWTSIPLLAYCVLPAVCMLRGTFFIPELSSLSSLLFLSLFICIVSTSILEIKWSGVGIDEWWKNQQFWVIGAVSAHIFAVFQGIVKLMAGINTSVTTTLKKQEDKESSKLYAFQWTILLIPPTTLLLINLVGVVAGLAEAVISGYSSWGVLFGKLFFSSWVILHLYPFLKGLLGRQNRTPTIVIVWSLLLAVSLAFFWVRIDPFIPNSDTPFLEDCGLDCK